MPRSPLKLSALLLILLTLLYAGTVNKISLGRESLRGLDGASMALDREVYQTNESVLLTITNTGSETLLVDSFYRLYRLENGRWDEIHLGFSFTGIGYQVGPGQNWSQTIPLMLWRNGKLEALPPGRYRIEKTVTIDRGRCGRASDEITLSAEFEVVG